MKNIFKVFKSNNQYSAAILIVRICVGVAMVYHGQKKIANPFDWMSGEFTAPAILQALAAISEFVGGMFLVAGLLTPLVSFGLLCTMGFAVYKHAFIDGGAFVGGKGSYELSLTYFVIMVMMLVAGPGKFSLDRAIFGQK